MDNRSFWDKRYSVAPQLGSGRGSRGYAAVRKNELVRRAIREHKITSILDVGCGDLCWLDGEIADMLAHLPRERTYASIAFHGPLPDFVRSIRDDLQAEPIGRYRWQTVYEIMRRGNMEKES